MIGKWELQIGLRLISSSCHQAEKVWVIQLGKLSTENCGPCFDIKSGILLSLAISRSCLLRLLVRGRVHASFSNELGGPKKSQLVQASCVRHPWWWTEAKLAIVFTYFFLFFFFFFLFLSTPSTFHPLRGISRA